MSTIKVTRAESGLMQAEVLRAERITPHMVRVTLGGTDLRRLTPRGFDQWVRLALPASDATRFDNLADTFGIAGYLKFLTLPKATRPIIRNYTIRQARPDLGEVDLDFVVHGDDGVAGPWAAQVTPGAEVALIDQGCGFVPTPADETLLIADESGLPAVAGVLRDLPRDTVGHAIIELFDVGDIQETGAPDGVEIQWLTRHPDDDPGTMALPALRALGHPTGSVNAFAVGEQALATGARRYLIGECGVPKQNVTFSGYWRIGKAYPT